MKLYRVSRKNFRGKLGTIFVARRKCTAYFSFFFFFFLFFSPLAQVSVCVRVRPQICPSVPRCRAAPQVQLIHKIVGMRGVQRMFNSNFIVQAVLFVCTETGYATRYARENVTRTFIQNTATRFVCASRECNSLLNLLYPVSRPGGREDLRTRAQ